MRRCCPAKHLLVSSSFVRGKSMTIRDALNGALAEEMSRDSSVVIMGEEVAEYDGAYKVTRGLRKAFGSKRVIDMPITEHGFAGVACGAALAGEIRPICEFMTWNFAIQAMDQIVNTAAKSRYMSGGQLSCPVVFRGPNGPALGVAAQHSQCLASWLASIPGLVVVAPFSSVDARGLIKAAVRSNDPVCVLEHELSYGDAFDMNDDALSPDFVIPFGKAKVEREGSDVSIVSFSRSVGYALEAATILHDKHKVEAEVINLRSIKPLDRETIIQSVKKTHRIMTVDESYPTCNVGAEIAAVLMESEAFDYLDAPLERVSVADVPMPYAIELESAAKPSANDVAIVALRILNKQI